MAGFSIRAFYTADKIVGDLLSPGAGRSKVSDPQWVKVGLSTFPYRSVLSLHLQVVNFG